LTPGILPCALRAGFAVRTRSCACVGQQKKSDSAFGRRSKRSPRRRPGRGDARDRRPRAKSLDDQPSGCWRAPPAFAGM